MGKTLTICSVFLLTVAFTLAEPICGNGILEAGERCDDGNRISLDGCDVFCDTETTFCVDDEQRFRFETDTDFLELDEPIGEVIDTISTFEVPSMPDGTIVTAQGATDYFQFLRFKEQSELEEVFVTFTENEEEEFGDYLFIEQNKPFYQHFIQFPEGLESDIEGDVLEDLLDKSFFLLEEEVTIVDARLEGDRVDLVLMQGEVSDTLVEGETRTYVVDGTTYEVTLVFVSDPGSNVTEAKFSINGELTDALQEGDIDVLSDGLIIGVRNILANARDGVVSFFLGANKIELTDPSTDDLEHNGHAEVNNENIEDASVAIKGAHVGDNFQITEISYRLVLDPLAASDTYVPEGSSVRDFIAEPEGLLSKTLDFHYEGLINTTETNLTADVQLSLGMCSIPQQICPGFYQGEWNRSENVSIQVDFDVLEEVLTVELLPSETPMTLVLQDGCWKQYEGTIVNNGNSFPTTVTVNQTDGVVRVEGMDMIRRLALEPV